MIPVATVHFYDDGRPPLAVYERVELPIPAPPLAYQRLPLPPGNELALPLPIVGQVCRALGLKTARLIYGCAKWIAGGCLTVIPQVDRVISAQDQAQVREHEDAHCRGWPAGHPGR